MKVVVRVLLIANDFALYAHCGLQICFTRCRFYRSRDVWNYVRDAESGEASSQSIHMTYLITSTFSEGSYGRILYEEKARLEVSCSERSPRLNCMAAAHIHKFLMYVHCKLTENHHPSQRSAVAMHVRHRHPAGYRKSQSS